MTKQSSSLRLISHFSSQKFSLYVLSLLVTIFFLFQIWSFHVNQHIHFLSAPPPPLTSQEVVNNEADDDLFQKLRLSVTFLPLKDLRFVGKPLDGHTWFMSSLYDKQETAGEVQFQEFPSESSNGRLLCLKGHDGHDGSWNYYALAWPEALPANASLMEGLTFVSYNHYDYDNMWHGLSALFPFVAWSLRNNCQKPARWALYHWGEIRLKMGHWLSNLTTALYGKNPEFEGLVDDRPFCFEKAVVMRHNEGGMSRERRLETYDLMRCKARMYCNLSTSGTSSKPLQIGMTLLMRTGPRSFANDSAVIGVFNRECKKLKGCRLTVAYSDDLAFCQQVKLMSETDVLVSPHGAQLTNIFLMDRNSSIMEFFPKGWLKLAGVGQFVYHWQASWSGMRHEGVWRDPNGAKCPYSENDRRCMSVYKNGKIGFNETYFGEWARSVLGNVKRRKLEELRKQKDSDSSVGGCYC